MHFATKGTSQVTDVGVSDSKMRMTEGGDFYIDKSLTLGTDGAYNGKITFFDTGSHSEHPEIYTDADANLILKAHGNNSDIIIDVDANGGDFWIINQAETTLMWMHGTTGDTQFTGNLGVGLNPTYKLHVDGDGLFTDDVTISDGNLISHGPTGNTKNQIAGKGAGAAITTAGWLTLYGTDAGNALTTQNYNMLIGYAAGKDATITDVTAFGYLSMSGANGLRTIAVGSQSGYDSNADDCVYIGVSAGLNNTTSDKLLIGSLSGTLIEGQFADNWVKIWGDLETSGNLGLGISPAHRLHVNGNAFIEGSVTVEDGAFVKWGDGSTGMDGTSANGFDQFRIFTDTTERLAIDQYGEVVIVNNVIISDGRLESYGPAGIDTNQVAGGGNTGVNMTATAACNTLYGANTGHGIVDGLRNTYVGYDAGYGAGDVNDATALGYWALEGATGIRTTAIGSRAGRLSTGADGVYLGYNAGLSNTTDNKLFITNNTGTLIEGDFANDWVEVKGEIRANTGEITHVFNILGTDMAGTDLLSVEGNSLQTASLAKFYSNSASVGNRYLVTITNANPLAADAIPLKLTQNSPDTLALVIEGGTFGHDCYAVDTPAWELEANSLTTAFAITVQADGLTTGGALNIISGSTSSMNRRLVYIENTSSSANGTIALQIDQNANEPALFVSATGVTTDHVVSIYGNSLTTGSLAYLYSNSSSTANRSLLEVINDNPAADNTHSIYVQQDGNIEGLWLMAGGVTSGTAMSVIASNLTTGYISTFQSSSTSTGTRALVRILNDATQAVNTTCLLVSDAGLNVAIRTEGGDVNINQSGDLNLDGGDINLLTGSKLTVANGAVNLGSGAVSSTGSTQLKTLNFAGSSAMFTVPRLTTSQINNLTGVVDGVIVFNTTLTKYQAREGGGWYYIT
jgi:hypothetical protein